MRFKNLFPLLCIIIVVSFACDKQSFGPNENNDPENNFELFWSDFDHHYALFQVRRRNWDSIYTAHRPNVNAQTTNDALWDIFDEMIEYLDDSHVAILDYEKRQILKSGDELNEAAKKVFNLDLIESKYIEDLQSEQIDTFRYGKIKNKDIGYIRLSAMFDFDANGIDNVLDKLRKHKAIVFDIRGNRGGQDLISERLANAFADGEHFVYTVQNRIGPNHDDFEDPVSFFTKPEDENSFTKPVILLTDRATISAAETFCLRMKTFAHVVQIGDATAGDFGDASNARFLPNGWMYFYSINKFLLPNGTSLDGIGNVPKVAVKNKPSDILAGNDIVIEQALQYLRDTLGIE